jgi:hypothetical protein
MSTKKAPKVYAKFSKNISITVFATPKKQL